MQSPHNAEHGVRSNKLLIQTLANHRKVWPPPRCLAPRCRASPAGAGIVALHRKIFSQARRLAPRSRGRLAMQTSSRCATRFPQAQCFCTTQSFQSCSCRHRHAASQGLATATVPCTAQSCQLCNCRHRRAASHAASHGLATATVPSTAQSCQPCKCTHLRAASQGLATATMPSTALSYQFCRCFIFALLHKVWSPPRCIAPRSRASLTGASIVVLHRKILRKHGTLHRAVLDVLQVHASSRCATRFPQAQCLVPRSRANLEVAWIVALHRKVWPPPRCLAPRCRASLASARIVALHRKVWPPPRCLTPRCRASLAGASSSRCTARFGHRHGALHRAVVPALQVHASSCCIARRKIFSYARRLAQCLAPRSRPNLEVACIVVLHRKVWPPPRCLVVLVLQVHASPRRTARFGHRHGAFHLAVVPAVQVHASLRCPVRFGHRHGALHRAVMPFLQVQASSRCPAKIGHKHNALHCALLHCYPSM